MKDQRWKEVVDIKRYYQRLKKDKEHTETLTMAGNEQVPSTISVKADVYHS